MVWFVPIYYKIPDDVLSSQPGRWYFTRRAASLFLKFLDIQILVLFSIFDLFLFYNFIFSVFFSIFRLRYYFRLIALISTKSLSKFLDSSRLEWNIFFYEFVPLYHPQLLRSACLVLPESDPISVSIIWRRMMRGRSVLLRVFENWCEEGLGLLWRRHLLGFPCNSRPRWRERRVWIHETRGCDESSERRPWLLELIESRRRQQERCLIEEKRGAE